MHDQRPKMVAISADGIAVSGDVDAIVAELRTKEIELRRVNRALRTISSCTQAVIHAATEAELLAQICRVIVEEGGYRLAWVGFAEHDARKSVRVVGSAGFESGYLEKADITWADEPRGHGPTGTAIRTGLAAVCRDVLTDPQFAPWREDAVNRGYASSIVQPLLADGRVFGAVSIYATEPDAFDQEEVDLLTELAGDLAYGIVALRTRDEKTNVLEALRKSEAELTEAQRLAHVGSWHLDLATNQVAWTEELYRMLAWDSDKAPPIYSEQQRFFTPESWKLVCAAVLRTRETGNPYKLELEMIRADGRRGWMLARGEALRDGGSAIMGLRGTAQDITERKLAEESLRHEQLLFSSLFRTIPDSIYFKDRRSRFVRINDLMARSFGLSDANEAVGRTDFDFFTEEHASQAYRDEQRVMSTGEPVIGFEEKETWPDGRITWVSSTKFPLRDADGQITGLVGISRDITLHKLIEERLRHSQKMDAIGQLSAGVAHDFNNLLTVIRGQLDLLRLNEGNSAENAGLIDVIGEAADRAANLTRQLLLVGRQQVVHLAGHDLNEIVGGLDKMLRRLVGATSMMQVVLAAEPLPIQADAGMVGQLLLNLAVNARDAMPQGGSVRITTESVELDELAAQKMAKARPGKFVCLAFGDTGTGIAPEVMAHIFEPFFTTKNEGKGTGLGLATVYGVMQQHGGWVTVESEVGRGTTFRAYFPRLIAAPRA